MSEVPLYTHVSAVRGTLRAPVLDRPILLKVHVHVLKRALQVQRRCVREFRIFAVEMFHNMSGFPAHQQAKMGSRPQVCPFRERTPARGGPVHLRTLLVLSRA